MQLRIGEFRAIDAAADQRAAHAEPLDRILQLLGGEIGIGERDRGEADKAVRRLAADLGDLLVLQFDDLRLEVALGLVPEIRIDAQRLDIDALLVHDLDALGRDDELREAHLLPRQLERIGDVAMRVNIDGRDPLSGDDDLAPARLLWRLRRASARSR